MVYGEAPRFSICFVAYDCGPSGPNESAGKVEFGNGLELSDKREIGFSFNTFWGKTVDTKFAFKLPRYGNEHEVRMQILPESRIVGAIAWDDSVDAMSYPLSGMSPQEWAASELPPCTYAQRSWGKKGLSGWAGCYPDASSTVWY